MKLQRLKNNEWQVVINKNEISFPNIEEAAEWLNTLGVHDDELDFALADIYALGHIAAEFGLNGTYMYSYEAK